MLAPETGPPPRPSLSHERPVGSVAVGVPEVATTAEDGLGKVLLPGRYEVAVHVLLNVAATPRDAQLRVDGRPCTSTVLSPGAVAPLTCDARARAGRPLTVQVVAGGQVLRTWEHRVSR